MRVSALDRRDLLISPTRPGNATTNSVVEVKSGCESATPGRFQSSDAEPDGGSDRRGKVTRRRGDRGGMRLISASSAPPRETIHAPASGSPPPSPTTCYPPLPSLP